MAFGNNATTTATIPMTSQAVELPTTIRKMLAEAGLVGVSYKAERSVIKPEQLAFDGEDFVSFIITGSLCVLTPIGDMAFHTEKDDYYAYAYCYTHVQGAKYPPIRPEYFKHRYDYKRAPEGYSWVVHELRTTSTISFPHAAREMVALADMYMAAKHIAHRA